MNPNRENGSSPLNTYGLEQTKHTAAFSALRFFRHWQFVIGTSLVIGVSSFVIQRASAQDFLARATRLSRDYFKNGSQTLLAFEPISRATRDSVVKIDLDGNTVALAAVIGASGLAVTKASDGGLQITLPAQRKSTDAVGLMLTARVKGNVEITAAYDILHADQPTTGHGVGFELYVTTDTPTNEGLGLLRVARVNEGEVYVSSRITTQGGRRA